MRVRQVWCQKSVQWAVAWTQTLWPQASVLNPFLFDFQTGGYEGESEMMSNRASQIVFHHRLHENINRCAWLWLRALHHDLDLSTALDRASSWSETLKSKVMALLKHTAAIYCSPQPLTLHNLAQKQAKASCWSRSHRNAVKEGSLKKSNFYLASVTACPNCFAEVLLAVTRRSNSNHLIT